MVLLLNLHTLGMGTEDLWPSKGRESRLRRIDDDRGLLVGFEAVRKNWFSPSVTI